MDCEYYESHYSDHGINQITVDTVKTQNEEHATSKLNGKSLQFELDSGAETNVLKKQDFQKIVPKKQRNSKLKPSTAKLTAFGGHDIPVIGKCSLKCERNNNTHVLTFEVVESGKSLLGCEDCKKLNLITFNVNDVQLDCQNKSAEDLSKKIFTEYANCFEGLKSISVPYHIKIDSNAVRARRGGGPPPTFLKIIKSY